MRNLLLATVTLLALSAPAAFASTELGRVSPGTNDLLVNSLTGGSIDGRLPIAQLTNNL
jgi:hypothetical protein